MLYRVIGVLLIPAILYDWFTSLLGAAAAFQLNASSPLYVWGIPVVISLTALSINALTTDIFSEANPNGWLALFWFICIVYDSYTTYLGLAHIASGGAVFSLP